MAGQRLGDAAIIKRLESGALCGAMSVDLWDNRLTDATACALAQNPHLMGVRTLQLGWNYLGPAGAQALAGSPYAAHLEALLLYHNDLGDLGAAAILDSPYLKPMSINMCGNALGVACVERFDDRSLAHVRVLHLGGNQLESVGMNALMASGLGALEELNVRANGIGPDGMRRVVRGIRRLILEENPIGDAGIEALAESGALADVEFLHLGDTALSPKGLAVLAGLELPALRKLNLMANPIGDDGARVLVQAAWLEKLDELVLRDTGITVGEWRGLEHCARY